MIYWDNFTCIDNYELTLIDGGVSKLDVALCIAGMFCPPIGVLGAVKTCSDWLDEQPW